MGKPIVRDSLEWTLFYHLLSEYQDLITGSMGDHEKAYERLQKANLMLEAWKKYIPNGGTYDGRNFLAPIESDYNMLHYFKGLLDSYLGDKYAPDKETPHQCPEGGVFPAGYEQAFQAIVLQSIAFPSKGSNEIDEEWARQIKESIDWSKFCHLHEELRKTWDIRLSTTHFTDDSGEAKKLGTIRVKDNPQA